MSEQVVGGNSFEELVDNGVFEFAGFDENEEITFRLDPEAAKVKAPEIYSKHQDEMLAMMFKAVDEGYIEWEVTVHAETGELEQHIVFTEKCAEFAEEEDKQ